MKPIIIGNWKMHLTASDVGDYARTFLAEPDILTKAEVTICPAAPLIPAVAGAFSNSPVQWGGQNAHWETQGAFTGETSMAMLSNLGCRLVLCGHSERRKFFHETDEMVSRKVEQATAHSMVPVLCVGETYEQRHQQQHEVVVMEQIRKGIDLLSAFPSLALYVAYEPVWAISTNQAIEPNPSDIIAMARLIRNALREELPTGAESVPILFGGNVNPQNAKKFVDGEVVTGVLVGGASLNPKTFHQIVTQLV